MCYILIFSSHSSSYPRSDGVCRLVRGPSPGPTIVTSYIKISYIVERKKTCYIPVFSFNLSCHSSPGYAALVARLSTQKCPSMGNKKEKETYDSPKDVYASLGPFLSYFSSPRRRHPVLRRCCRCVIPIVQPVS